MFVSITKLELKSYSKFFAFFRFNGQIIKELQGTACKQYEISCDWKLKTWYTMTLWEKEEDINSFYRSGTHLQAMKQSPNFSNNLSSKRVNSNTMLPWKEAKALFNS